jgi:hypothetical protein
MTSSDVHFTFPSFDDIVRVKRPDGGVDIMLNGERIDSIEPVKHLPTQEENEEFLRRWRELSKIVSEHWNDPNMSAVDAVREQRRNLTPDEWVSPGERFDK